MTPRPQTVNLAHRCAQVGELIVAELFCYVLQVFEKCFLVYQQGTVSSPLINTSGTLSISIWRLLSLYFENNFCQQCHVGPQKSSQDFLEPETKFSGKFFKSVNKTQFEVHLQTQVVQAGCTALEKTLIIRYQILLFLEFKEF